MTRLSILRRQLTPIFRHIMSEITNNDDEYKDGQINDKILKQLNDYLKTFNKNSWENLIIKVNRSLDKNKNSHHWDNSDTMKITPATSRILKSFIQSFGDVKYDVHKSELQRIKDEEIYEDESKQYIKKKYHTTFAKDWTMTPIWYHIEHDSLLLELALKYNFDTNKYINELNTNVHTYSMRFRDLPQINDVLIKKCLFASQPYQDFILWVTFKENILHRLRYLTNNIISNLFEIRPLIISVSNMNIDFSRFEQKNILFTKNDQLMHHQHVNQELKKLSIKNYDLNRYNDDIYLWKQTKAIEIDSLDIKTDNIDLTVDDDDVDDASESGSLGLDMEHMQKEYNEERQMLDGYKRDIKKEFESLCYSVDLVKYGKPMASFIINQLTMKQNDALWDALSILLSAVPFQMSLDILKEYQTQMQLGRPELVNKVCKSIVDDTFFPLGASLRMAEFFDDLSSSNLVTSHEWKEYKVQYARIAQDIVNGIESDVLLFLLLTIPMFDTSYKTNIIELALNQQRVTFLTNERINQITTYIYNNELGFQPRKRINFKKKVTYKAQLNVLLSKPFYFYITSAGFNWCMGVLYFEYMVYVLAFALHQKSTFDIDAEVSIWEALLWIFNVGYILYEINEWLDKGAQYFDIKSGENFMDILICIVWVILFVLWFVIRFSEIAMHIYVTLFGFQVVLIAVRSLLLFKMSTYLGVQLKIIEQMSVEIIKFAFIAAIVMCGFWFGLYYACGFVSMNDENDEVCSDTNPFRIGWYVFQLFVGVADTENAQNPITIIFAMVLIIVGAITLLNLMIALMTSTYEHINENIKEQIIFNKTITTMELANQRQRLMPQPLNIIVVIIVYIIHALNFITSMIHPRYLNIYCYIDSRYYNFWKKFSCKKCKTYDNSNERDDPKAFYKTRIDVIKFYIGLILRNNKYKLHHKGCYSCLKIKMKNDKETINGIEMKKYFKMYESVSKLKFDPNDKNLLNYLTFNVLFCEYCYRAFVPKNVDTDLITPFRALLDIVSCYIFVLFPIALIPLIVIYSLGTLYEICTNTSNDNDTPNEYSSYDREYLPNKPTQHTF